MINEPVDAAGAAVRRISDEILRRQRFLLTSHARPDGDSIGSQLAMAFALEALGKEVRIVNADPAPDHYQDFPGMERIEIASQVAADVDAVIVMECSDLSRTGVAGLEPHFLINIDHHAGNRLYGAVNWHDESAAACGEMVFDDSRAGRAPEF
jgi:phosphoesterase RecJ-like protein